MRLADRWAAGTLNTRQTRRSGRASRRRWIGAPVDGPHDALHDAPRDTGLPARASGVKDRTDGEPRPIFFWSASTGWKPVSQRARSGDGNKTPFANRGNLLAPGHGIDRTMHRVRKGPGRHPRRGGTRPPAGPARSLALARPAR